MHRVGKLPRNRRWAFLDRDFPGLESGVRVDFSHFEALRCLGQEVRPHPGWSLNPHGVHDSHIPECFSHVHFSARVAGV